MEYYTQLSGLFWGGLFLIASAFCLKKAYKAMKNGHKRNREYTKSLQATVVDNIPSPNPEDRTYYTKVKVTLDGKDILLKGKTAYNYRFRKGKKLTVYYKNNIKKEFIFDYEKKAMPFETVPFFMGIVMLLCGINILISAFFYG